MADKWVYRFGDGTARYVGGGGGGGGGDLIPG